MSKMVDNMENNNNSHSLYDDQKERFLLDRIEKLCGKESFRPKLDHMKTLLSEDIRAIEKRSQVVVVAGTNGKGGTCHHLKNILSHQNVSYGLWTSPHVLTLCERFNLSGAPISYEQLIELIEENSVVARESELSFYEFLFFIFTKWVSKNIPDVLILEVGLGGRFDAVNIFTEPLTAIVSISRDHTEILGKDLKSILFEKYGVVRKGGTLISGIEQNFLKETLSHWIARDEVNFVKVQRHEYSYEITNQRIALELFSRLNIERDSFDLAQDYTHKIMPNESRGRREKMTINARELIFIGAHNFDGHRKMLAELYGLENSSHVFILGFSTGREDQLENIIDLYSKYPCLVDEIILSDYSHPRAIAKEVLLSFKDREEVLIADDINLNWEFILTDESYKNKKIIISGSYFFIGEWQKYILDHHS